MRYAQAAVIAVLIGAGIALMSAPGTASAATDCTFTVKKTTMRLDADCTTDATILIPDGMTLDGNGHTITAVDPGVGHFVGAVVRNGGTSAYVTKLTVTVSGLANVCDAGDDRLRGIMFEGASGSITHSAVIGLNQGPSGCQEGNAIEVRNEPFDGTHPNTLTVEVAHNVIDAYQKTGIVANGDVDVDIQHNKVGASATQADLAANSIQLGFGASGVIKHNDIVGNSWAGPSDYAATAILIYQASAFEVSQNNISGNSDLGIYIYADNGEVTNNRVSDSGLDGLYDIGIGDYGTGNVVTNNKLEGFETALEGVDPNPGTNKVKASD